MEYKTLNRLGAMAAAGALALLLIGCRGTTGQTGTAGTNGNDGSPGTPGINGTNGAYIIDAAVMSSADWVALQPKGSITSATVSSSQGQPVINFVITDANGNGIKNLDTFTKFNSATDLSTSYPNFGFNIAKLVPGTVAPTGNTTPSQWVNYLVATVPTVASPNVTPTKPTSADSHGHLVGHGDGSYTYTFYTDITQAAPMLATATPVAGKNFDDLGDVSFNAAATTRVAVVFSGSARNTGTNTPTGAASLDAAANLGSPINLVYDFIPATGLRVVATDNSREITTLASCDACHTKLTYHGNRVEPQYCVICHTDQMKYGTVAAGRDGSTAYTSIKGNIGGQSEYKFDTLVHQLHMGEALQMTNHDATLDALPNDQTHTSSLPVNEVRYPQSAANCTTCHAPVAAAPQAGNWQTVPSRAACGACHDLVDFVAGTNHLSDGNPLPQPNDTLCATCHTPAYIAGYHAATVPPDATNGGLTIAQGGVATNTHTNASYLSGNSGNLPSGAVGITWNVKSVTVNSTHNPVIVFKFVTPDGNSVAFNQYSSTGPATQEMVGPLANYNNATFVGGPYLMVAFNATQDGIVAPADYNKQVTVGLKTLWRGGVSGSTLSGPDGNGFYTATLGSIVVPTSATMVSGGVGYNYGVVGQAAINGTPAVTAADHVIGADAKTATATKALTDSLQLTQTNLPAFPYGKAMVSGVLQTAPYQGGLTVPAKNVWVVATNASGAAYASRRVIVDNNKCASCHATLGTFTGSTFHDGQRNDAQSCAFCHNTSGTDNGESYNAKEAIHALHASSNRLNPFSWETGSGHSYWNTTYPAPLNNCEACHNPGTYDFSGTAMISALPKMLWTTVASGTYPITDPYGYGINIAQIYALGNTTTLGTYSAGANAPFAPFLVPGVVTTGSATGGFYDASHFPTNYVVVNNQQPASASAHPVNVGYAVFGNGFTVNPTTAAVPVATFASVMGGLTSPNLGSGLTLEAEGTTLVNSPITSACYACHDSSTARLHMTGNGGSLNVPRSTVMTSVTVGGNTTKVMVNNEQCLICHGPGKIADIKTVHGNF